MSSTNFDWWAPSWIPITGPVAPLGPLLLTLLYIGVLSRNSEITRVTLFEAAMGPQIGAAIVSMQYGLDA